MGVLQIKQVEVGDVGDLPITIKMVTTDSLATITTAGYLNNQAVLGVSLSTTDIILALYNYNPSTGANNFGIFTVSLSGGVYTLVDWAFAANVLLPVTSGNFAEFNGVSGQIKNGPAPSNAANGFVVTSAGGLTIGNFPRLSDANGTIDTGKPPSSAGGSFVVMSPGGLTVGNFPALADANGTLAAGLPPSAAGQAFLVASPGTLTSGQLAKINDANGTIANSGVVAANVYQSSLASPDNPSDLIWHNINATFTALAGAGTVLVQASSGAKRYIVRDFRVVTSTGLSGGGGDRLLAITDGTNVFNDTGVTAALLGAPVNTVWGGTGNPLPLIAWDTQSVAGANIVLQYTGGTLDYTAGDVQIDVLVERVV